MIKTIGHGWRVRTAVISGACAMAIAGAAGTAAAAEAQAGSPASTASTVHAGRVGPQNSSPNLYGPNAATLSYFCGQFSLWHRGAAFDGVNNAGGRDEWAVTNVTDSTGDTAFEGVNDFSQIVKWYCG